MTDIVSFDPAYYLKQYPALADYGYNEANAQQHFVQYGAAELRLPSAEFEGKLTESSVFNYYEQNPELADALGIAQGLASLDAAQQGELVNHYVMYGYNEGRPGDILDSASAPIATTELEQAIDAVAQAQQEQTATHEAIAAELGAAPENVDEALAQSEAEAAAALDTVIPGFAAASTGASQQNLVHAKQNELQAQVDLAKAHVAAVPGLAGKAKALGQASSAYEHAVRDAAANYENYELAKASLVAQGASEVSATGLNGEGDFTVTVNLPEDQSVTYRANDKGQIIADYSESGKAAAAEIKGLNQFQAAVQGMYENTQAFAKGGAVTQAQAKLDAALAKVQDAEGTTRPDTPTDPEDGGETDNPDTPTDPEGSDETDSLDELAAAQNESAAYQVAAIGSDGQIEVNGVKTTSQAFETQLDTSLMPLSAQVVATEKAVEDFQNQAEQFFQYAAWRQELNDAQDTVDSAREDLESLLDEEDMVLHGEDETAATEGNDLFIFGSHLADAEIFDFGASGADQIYFGHEMSFVAVDEQTQIGTSAVGELDVLEIFAQQTEDGVTLYVENESFDGSSVHGLQGMAELQLVGVSLDSLQFNNGFLSNTVVAVDTDAIA